MVIITFMIIIMLCCVLVFFSILFFPPVQFSSISFIFKSDWGPDPDARPLLASQCGSLYPDPFSTTTPVRP